MRTSSEITSSIRGLLSAVLIGAAALSAQPASAQQVVHTVEIIGSRFVPEEVVIRPGDSIRWINRSRGVHTVTADPRVAADPNLVLLPRGALPFDSGYIRPQQAFTEQFVTPGRYQYICNPHAMMGMVGRVVVSPQARRGVGQRRPIFPR